MSKTWGLGIYDGKNEFFAGRRNVPEILQADPERDVSDILTTSRPQFPVVPLLSNNEPAGSSNASTPSHHHHHHSDEAEGEGGGNEGIPLPSPEIYENVAAF